MALEKDCQNQEFKNEGLDLALLASCFETLNKLILLDSVSASLKWESYASNRWFEDK